MFAVSIVTSQVPSITWTTNLFIYKKNQLTMNVLSEIILIFVPLS